MSRYLNILPLVVVFLSSWTALQSSAHSTHAPLLKRALNPRTVSLDILPRRPSLVPTDSLTKRSSSSPAGTLRFDDSFRLTLSAFDDIFHLHLRPNDHLIHPAARVSYYKLDSNGQSVLDREEPLLREDVKAYYGEVIAPHQTESRLKEDAAGVEHRPGLPAEMGWARIMVHHQGDSSNGIPPIYEGAFSANGVIYHITTKENYMRKKHDLDPEVAASSTIIDDHLVIWRDSDAMTPEEEHLVKTGMPAPGPLPVPQSCAHDNLDFNRDPALNPALRKPLPPWLNVLLRPRSLNDTVPHQIYRRQDVGDSSSGDTGMGTNFAGTIGQTDGCPTTQKIVYMGIAADCEYVTKQGGEEQAKTQILNTWNTASALYKTAFKVSLGITQLIVQPPACPASPDPANPWNVGCSGVDLSNRLSLFSDWRGQRPEDGNGLWHLMSGCPTGAEVGIAWLATLCRTSSAGSRGRVVSGTAVSTSGRTEWQVVAHEIGHNFGAIHDCAQGCSATDRNCCPLTPNSCDAEARFIMSPVAQSGEKVFSPCSVGNICSLMQGAGGTRTDTTCLVDPDPTKPTISLQMCGNGIVENGEDCDPGAGVDSPCCDPTTCKFRPNAVCDPDSSPCCTRQCSFAPATQVCRASKDQRCDTPEMCTGTSSSCPADTVMPNGQSCGDGDLKCASGQCTSIGEQCKLVGGSMNLSEPCPDKSDQSCQISCKDPRQSNVCVRLTSLLVDGSLCGYGGTCISGRCQSAGFIETAKAWYTSNLQIAIPVTIVAGLVLILILWGIFSSIRRCCGGGSRARPATVILPPMQHHRLPSQEPPMRNVHPSRSGDYARLPPPARHDRSGSEAYNYQDYNYNANNRANWVDDRAYNGNSNGGWR